MSFAAGSAGLFEGVKRESNAGGNPEFLKDPEQVILDGMFTEREPLGDLAIAVSFGDQNGDLLFAFAQRTGPGQSRHGGAMLDEGLEHVVKSDGTDPNLAFLDAANTLAESFESVRPGEDAAGAGTKCLHYQSAIEGIEQNHDAELGMTALELADKLHALDRIFGDPNSDQNHFKSFLFEQLENFLGSGGGDGMDVFAALQGIGEQVAAHSDAVGDQHFDSRLGIGNRDQGLGVRWARGAGSQTNKNFTAERGQ